jgi:hypothetical protein
MSCRRDPRAARHAMLTAGRACFGTFARNVGRAFGGATPMKRRHTRHWPAVCSFAAARLIVVAGRAVDAVAPRAAAAEQRLGLKTLTIPVLRVVRLRRMNPVDVQCHQ